MSTDNPLGPIMQAIVKALWQRLFDAAPDNPIYLPRIVKNGYPPWNLPSYDPAYPSGKSNPFSIPGVPQDVANSACTSNVPISPIATAAPALQLLNVMFTNLSVMSPLTLTFSDTDPQFTATVGVGTQQNPFTLQPVTQAEPNFLFQVPCCEPVSAGSRQCGQQKWDADASGHFTATAYGATIALQLQLNVPVSGPLTVTIISLIVSDDPNQVCINFDLIGQLKWVQQMAQIAVQQGVGNNALVLALNSFLNQPDVLGNIETLVNNALKNFPSWFAYA